MPENFIAIIQVIESTISMVEQIVNQMVFPFLRAWWWVFPPIFLFKPLHDTVLAWRQDVGYSKREYVLLEIRLPEETLKPIKAMEHVISTLHIIMGAHDPGNWKEKWINGDSVDFPSLSFEIASFGGESHFFIRVEAHLKDWVESALYSQYPDIQISEAEDYVLRVPQDIPNANWNMQNREWKLKKESCYPLKTYKEFESGTESKEEKRVDPIARLLESFSVLEKSEQIWVQFNMTDPGDDWIEEGEKERDKLVKRPEKASDPEPLFPQLIKTIIHGPQDAKKAEEPKLLPPEMMLTPGEREVVKSIEEKISKPGFKCSIRTMYLAKEDDFKGPHLGLPIAYLQGFNTNNLNKFKGVKQGHTGQKTFWWWLFGMDDRNNYVRKRKLFKRYKKRKHLKGDTDHTSVFNTEELASLFHLPSRVMAPAPDVSRIGAKTGEAPPDLPIE